MGLRAGPDTEAGRRILYLCRGSNPGRPVVQSVVRHYTELGTPAPDGDYKHVRNVCETTRRSIPVDAHLHTDRIVLF
jgi:hypothetical protein